ncbi:hypothetical protein BH23BAC3_BH23BAC3_24280 [soil metagenome]
MSEPATSSQQPCRVDTERFIHETARGFKNELESLDFSDPAWELYTPRHDGYIPHNEAMEHIAEDMIDEKFNQSKRNILKLFSQAKADFALLNQYA